MREWALDDDLLANALSAGITLLRERAIGEVKPDTVKRVSQLTDFAAQQLASPFDPTCGSKTQLATPAFPRGAPTDRSRGYLALEAVRARN